MSPEKSSFDSRWRMGAFGVQVWTSSSRFYRWMDPSIQRMWDGDVLPWWLECRKGGFNSFPLEYKFIGSHKPPNLGRPFPWPETWRHLLNQTRGWLSDTSHKPTCSLAIKLITRIAFIYFEWGFYSLVSSWSYEVELSGSWSPIL